MTHNFKIAIVAQQCGVEVLAGAERYALNLGLALAKQGCDVKIFTTQSSDYQTWANTLAPKEYVPADSAAKAKVELLRFPNHSHRKRRLQKLARALWQVEKFSPINLPDSFSRLLDRFFLWAQGPWCPQLWQELARKSATFDLIIFKSYLYAPAFYGLHSLKQAKRTLLIPAAHPEHAFFRPFVRTMFQMASVLGFVSKAEKELVEASWPFTINKETLMLPPGLGNEWQKADVDYRLDETVRSQIGALQNYFLVLGRLDKGKNLDLIFRNAKANTKVVFAGAGKITQPKDERFIFLGKVSEHEKKLLLQNALALLSVSKNEAFSMTTAEAMAEGCPVIGHKESHAVRELIERFGGAQFHTDEELQYLLENFNLDSDLRKSALPKREKAREELSWKRSAENLLIWLNQKQLN